MNTLKLIDWVLLATALAIVMSNVAIRPEADLQPLSESLTQRVQSVAKHQRMLHAAAASLEQHITELHDALDQLTPSQPHDTTTEGVLTRRGQQVLADTHTDLLQHITSARAGIEEARHNVLMRV